MAESANTDDTRSESPDDQRSFFTDSSQEQCGPEVQTDDVQQAATIHTDEETNQSSQLLLPMQETCESPLIQSRNTSNSLLNYTGQLKAFNEDFEFASSDKKESQIANLMTTQSIQQNSSSPPSEEQILFKTNAGDETSGMIIQTERNNEPGKKSFPSTEPIKIAQNTLERHGVVEVSETQDYLRKTDIKEDHQEAETASQTGSHLTEESGGNHCSASKPADLVQVSKQIISLKFNLSIAKPHYNDKLL